MSDRHVVVLFAVIVVLVVASLGAEPMLYPQNQAAVGVAPSQEIRLQVTLNATTIGVGQMLNVTMTLLNILPETNSVPVANPINISAVSFPVAMWPTCIVPIPVQFVVVRGNYTLSGLSQLNTTNMYSPPQDECLEYVVNHIIFQPDSDIAMLNGTSFLGSVNTWVLGSIRLSTNFTLAGYWDYPISPAETREFLTPIGYGFTFMYPEVSPTPAHAFVPGVYTLVAVDEWGQSVVLHFTVTG